MISQQMHVYKYVQLHNAIFQQNVFVAFVIITGCFIRRIKGIYINNYPKIYD